MRKNFFILLDPASGDGGGNPAPAAPAATPAPTAPPAPAPASAAPVAPAPAAPSAPTEAELAVKQLREKELEIAKLKAIVEANNGKNGVDVVKLADELAEKISKQYAGQTSKEIDKMRADLKKVQEENLRLSLEKARDEALKEVGGSDNVIMALITGNTPEEIRDSVKRAAQEFQAVVEKAKGKTQPSSGSAPAPAPSAPPPTPAPAGGQAGPQGETLEQEHARLMASGRYASDPAVRKRVKEILALRFPKAS